MLESSFEIAPRAPQTSSILEVTKCVTVICDEKYKKFHITIVSVVCDEKYSILYWLTKSGTNTTLQILQIALRLALTHTYRQTVCSSCHLLRFSVIAEGQPRGFSSRLRRQQRVRCPAERWLVAETGAERRATDVCRTACSTWTTRTRN